MCALLVFFSPLAFSFFHRLITAFRCAFSSASHSLSLTHRHKHSGLIETDSGTRDGHTDESINFYAIAHYWLQLARTHTLRYGCELTFQSENALQTVARSRFIYTFFLLLLLHLRFFTIVRGCFFALNDYWICALLCVLFLFHLFRAYFFFASFGLVELSSFVSTKSKFCLHEFYCCCWVFFLFRASFYSVHMTLNRRIRARS